MIIEKQNNKCVAAILGALSCLIACFECCVQFMNKNAYIQTAIRGTNFCRSANNAFSLIARNAARFFVAVTLSYAVHFVGKIFIAVFTTIAGYLILMAMFPTVNPILPMVSFALLSCVIATVYMSVFGLAVDTTLQCFIMAEELKVVDKFVPSDLKKFMDNPNLAKSKVSDETR